MIDNNGDYDQYEDPEVNKYYESVRKPIQGLNGPQAIGFIIVIIIAVILILTNIDWLLRNRD